MRKLCFSIILLALLAGCSAIPGLQPQGTQAAVAFTPTPMLGGYTRDNSLVCPVAQFRTITSTEQQGNLAAWSPEGDAIAYITPRTEHAMYSGDLVVATGADFSQRLTVAEQAWGGLTWSPSGEQVAFVSLRPNDNVYTVMVVGRDGAAPLDLFPGTEAALDDYASPKMVAAWPTEGRLRVYVSCGIGCYKELEVSVPGGTKTEVPSIIQTPEPTAIAGLWRSPRNVRQYDAESMPELNDPSWSLDGQHAVYFDQDGFMWVLSTANKTAAPVEMVNASVLPIFFVETWKREMHWATNNRLAVRIENELEVFSVPCDSGLSILPTPTEE